MKKFNVICFIIVSLFIFTGLLYADQEGYGLGLIPSLSPKEKTDKIDGEFLSSFPEQLDWREDGWVTPVKHQGQCGSCWAFGTIAAMEARMRIQSNDPTLTIDLSEQDLVSCFNAGNGWGGCRGQYLDVTCNYLNSSGVTNEECFPYVANETSCANKCSDREVFKLRSWSFLPCTYVHKVRWRESNGTTSLYQLDIPSVETIKSAVIKGPIVAGFAVYDDFYSYSGGVYQPGENVNYVGLHAIAIVGWDDSDRSWICKNSWGTGWGDSGYFKIRWIESNLDDWSTGRVNDSTIIGFDAIQMSAEVEEPATTTTTADQPDPEEECCLDFNLLEGRAEEPSKIYLFFSVTDCDGEPKSDLIADDFEIYENSDYISKYESDQTILPAPKLYTMSTVLILDTSGSIIASETLESLKSSAKTFVDNVAGKDAQEVAIYLFDGRKDIKELVPFTREVSTLKNAIESMSREDIMSDPEYDKSTNLNGTVQKGLAMLNQRRSGMESEDLFTGTLVTFTDGTDQAARVSDSEAVNSVNLSEYASFTIGLGGEIDESHLADLGKDGFVWAENVGNLESAFNQIADKIEKESKKFYVLGYCSPKRAGNHSVTLKVTGCNGDLTYSFNADHFGPGCDTSEIMEIVDGGDDGNDKGDLEISGRVIGSSGRYVEGLSGVIVALHEPDGDFISSSVTDEYGGFTFDGLGTQAYVVQVEDSREFNPEKYELNLEETHDSLTFKEVKTSCAMVSMYGEDSDEVRLLRAFRDEVLSRTKDGQELIKIYYQLSPLIVNLIKEDSKLRSEIENMVNEALSLIRGGVK